MTKLKRKVSIDSLHDFYLANLLFKLIESTKKQSIQQSVDQGKSKIHPIDNSSIRNIHKNGLKTKSSSYQPPSNLSMLYKLNGPTVTSSLRPKRVSTSTGHQRPFDIPDESIFNSKPKRVLRSRTSSIGEESRVNYNVPQLMKDDENSSVLSSQNTLTPKFGSLQSDSPLSIFSPVSTSPNSKAYGEKVSSYSYDSSCDYDEYSDDDIGYLRFHESEFDVVAEKISDLRLLDDDYSDDMILKQSKNQRSDNDIMKSSKENDIFYLEIDQKDTNENQDTIAPYLKRPPLPKVIAKEKKDFSSVNIVGDSDLKYFNLKIIYQDKKTGFEATHDFPIKPNDIIGGRYEIKQYLGSAAFSRAVKCFDHRTNQMVCAKIIKNNKDYFDQSLDEIKLLTYLKESCNSECDKYNILHMYEYFYFKEHLFIICELLKDNLYEVYKNNRNSGEPLYFTIPRLQKLAWQCLVALEYIHNLNLIHCDLKPENILIKDYETCTIKVIDFGSSCFTTDQLYSYIQSRSYRAPEVILGHHYDQKIDLWSLGCILAELWTGKVIFQNDSIVTLLAKQIGILGLTEEDKEFIRSAPLVEEYFHDGMLYDLNTEEYIYPKKTSLKNRLQTDDPLFLSFVQSLLTFNPKNRPTTSQAMEHPWFKHKYED